MQYEEEAYTPTSGPYGEVATQDIRDGKLADRDINLIGGQRTLVNTGTVKFPASSTSFSLIDNTQDALPLFLSTGRYVGLSITVDSESRVITSYVATGEANPTVVVSPAFTRAPQSGAVYQIYSPAKEYLLFGSAFTGQTENLEEPSYKVFLRSSLAYVDIAYGQGILSDSRAAIGACNARAYEDCSASWVYVVSPGFVDTSLFGLPAGSPGGQDDCNRIVTDVNPNYCLVRTSFERIFYCLWSVRCLGSVLCNVAWMTIFCVDLNCAGAFPR
jgi:hypothetical protein